MKAFQADAQKFFPVIAIYKEFNSLKFTYLDVGVLWNELDEPFEAVEKITCCEKEALDQWVFFVCLLDLFFVVLEDDSDELDKGNEEGAEGNRAQVVSEYPVESSCEGATSAWVRSWAEVPKSTGCWDDELGHSNNECVDPKVAK